MSLTIITVKSEAYKLLAFGGISGVYATVGSATANAWRMVRFKNLTDQTVSISWDGTTDNLFLAAGEIDSLDFSTDRGPSNGLFLPQGIQFFVKDNGAATTSGEVVIEGFFS